MRCPKTAALLVAGLTVVAGCGRKAAQNTEPEAAPVAVVSTNTPHSPKPESPPKPEAKPATPAPVVSKPTIPTPAVSTPVIPTPKPEAVAALGGTKPPESAQSLAVAPPPKAMPTEPAAVTQPPVTQPPPANPAPPLPQPDAPKPKDPPKQEFEWPTSINGRPLSDYIREITDSDPAKREQALRTLPNFGPAAQKAASKLILDRMNSSKETDPGVRAAAYEAAGALGFESDLDTKEAVRILSVAADQGQRGGGTRLHAIQTLGRFGPKAESAINSLTLGYVVADPAYETRRAAASTLGEIALDEHNGPSSKALHCLADVLIKDKSAAVRLAAYQSIVLLGPPWQSRPKASTTGMKPPPPQTDTKAVGPLITAIKRRLVPFKAEPGSKEKESATGLVETDKQVEILARLALMRLDPKEATDENLTGIAKYLVGFDTGPKLQALQCIALMGEMGAKKIDDVVRVMLTDPDPMVVSTAVSTLVAMGKEAKPALESFEKLKTRPWPDKPWSDKEKEYKEYFTKMADEAIKLIKMPPQQQPVNAPAGN